ncbi:MAG: hypothetical protein CVV53_09730, partial [Spirochaetae bacterium HGW-Spirochaetae-9]
MEETESEPSTQHSEQAPASIQPDKSTKRIKLRRKPAYTPATPQGEENIQNGETGQNQAAPFLPRSSGVDENDLEQNPVIDVATAAALERETRNGFVRKQESFDRLINERPHENGKQEHSDSRARLLINDLSKMGIKDLRDLGAKYGINHDELIALKKQELIFYTLKSHTDKGGIIYAYGSLEILPDGYGFLRSPQNSYLSG